MAKKSARIRGIYGKPILRNTPFQMTPALLKRSARIILKSIKDEIRRDIAKSRGIRGGTYPTPYIDRSPVPLPDSRRFINSFRWYISGESTIEIRSTWPTAEAHTKTPKQRGIDDFTRDRPDAPRGGFPMTWLVQPKVKYARIETQGGKVIVRTTPMSTDKAWIHPGFMKYNFIERGVRKGRQEVVNQLYKEILEVAMKTGRLI